MKYEMKLDCRDSIVVLYRSRTKFEVNLGIYIEIIKYLQFTSTIGDKNKLL